VRGTDPRTGEEAVREPRAAAPLCALAFKVMTAEDRRLTYLRVYSGRLRAGDSVLNATRGQEEKVARLFRMHANKRERLDEAVAGDIVAATGLKAAATGDTLTVPGQPLLLEPMLFSNPVIALAVEPRASADTDRLSLALGKLAAEDPTLSVRTDPESGQNIVSGMGELHLEIVLDRLEREFRVPVRSGRPQVIYRETISREADRAADFQREIAGQTVRAEVAVHLRPLPRGAGERVLLGPLPVEPPEPIAAAVRGGITDSLGAGMLAGYPLVDLEARVTRLLFRPDDPLALGYRIAAARAFREATSLAGLILLEPLMRLEVVTPEEFTGEIIRDLAARRGRVDGMHPHGAVRRIEAVAPLRELFGYSTGLRSLSQGRASFTMHFAGYGEAPPEKP
jgi:elongation factor G